VFCNDIVKFVSLTEGLLSDKMKVNRWGILLEIVFCYNAPQNKNGEFMEHYSSCEVVEGFVLSICFF